MSTAVRWVAIMGLVTAMAASTALAQKGRTEDLLAPWRWRARLLLVFAPTAGDADLAAQRRWLRAARADADDRVLIPIEVVGDAAPAFLDPTAAAALRARFDVAPAQFAAVLIGKDGGEKLRAASPIPAERLFTVIDAMPMRRAERKCVR